MIGLALAFVTQVSFGGAKTQITYTYKTLAGVQSTVLYVTPPGDYYLALYADGRLSGKTVLVELKKSDGYAVGIAFSAGSLHLESCNFTFITKGKKQLLELVHRVDNLILLNSHVYIDGTSSLNIKTAAIQLLNSSIQASEIRYTSNSSYVVEGGFMTTGPPCQVCRAGDIEKQCEACPFDQVTDGPGKCKCRFDDAILTAGECNTQVRTNGFLALGDEFGYLLECMPAGIYNFDVTTTNSNKYISIFRDDSCNPKNMIIKGQITQNMNIDTEMGGLFFRINVNLTEIATYLVFTKLGGPSLRFGAIGNTISSDGNYDISNIILSGKLVDNTRAVTASFDGSYGGVVSYVADYTSQTIKINMHNILVHGMIINLNGIRNVGMLIGLCNNQDVTISDILITAKTAAFYLKNFDLESINFDEVVFPCKAKASVEMRDSLILGHIAKSFHADQDRTQFLGSYSNAGGLIGQHSGSRADAKVTISRVIADCDANGYSSSRDYSNWQNGILIGTINQTQDFTIKSAFAWGSFVSHCRGGAVAMVQNAKIAVTFACNLTTGTEYSSGPIGGSAGSTVVQQTGVIMTASKAIHEVGGVQGTVETNSVVTGNNCFGVMSIPAGGYGNSNVVGWIRGNSYFNGATASDAPITQSEGCSVNIC